MSKYSDMEFSQIVSIFENDLVSNDEIAELALALAKSGKIYKFDRPIFDFSSTGGPSSLSTLLVPLYLNILGASVVSIAVPGRPAGAVDVLAQIPNYNLNSSLNTMYKEPFYYHMEAGEQIAPLDRLLFDYRKKEGKVNVPNLAIASLLSKKIAGGAGKAGLDVRCFAGGNFGRDWDNCRKYAARYNAISKTLNIDSVCFLSDCNTPYQRYIGRLESLYALYMLMSDYKDDWLRSHNQYCMKMAQITIDSNRAKSDISSLDLKEAFLRNLARQGSNYEDFQTAARQYEKARQIPVVASKSGYVEYSQREIRSYLVGEQNRYSVGQRYPDPCGITLLADPRTYVQAGEPVLSIRHISPKIKPPSTLFQIRPEPVGIRESEVI